MINKKLVNKKFVKPYFLTQTLIEIVNIKTKPYYLLTSGRPYTEAEAKAKANQIYLQLPVLIPICHWAGLHDSFKLPVKIRNAVKPAFLGNIPKILRAACY